MRYPWDGLWYFLCDTLIASAIRLRWHRLWIREDEFHSSLDWDYAIMLHLGRKGRFAPQLLGISSLKKYSQDLSWRRTLAHNQGTPGSGPYYSYSDLRIRSFIAAWRALKIHITICDSTHSSERSTICATSTEGNLENSSEKPCKNISRLF